MLKAIQSRLHQGYRTNAFPERDPSLPGRYRGLPALDGSRCDACDACVERCPTDAIQLRSEQSLTLDLGRCIFCGDCASVCAKDVIHFSGSFRMGARTRDGLMLQTSLKAGSNAESDATPRNKNQPSKRPNSAIEAQLIEALDSNMRSIFGRAMKIRQISAGGCNACEADINVLETIGFDLSRFGISITASPRHADALLVTGPVSKNMELALKKTYNAMPEPKIVIAVGTCAISGGIFAGSPEVCAGADVVIPVDLYLPGCPPHPMTILNGMLALLGRLSKRA